MACIGIAWHNDIVTTQSASRPSIDRGALATARIRAGLSQADLATAAGISQPHMSRIESGARMYPHPRIIRAIAAALNMDIDSLVSAGDVSAAV